MNGGPASTVWVVEDDPDLLELIAHLLRRAGLHVEAFDDGNDVLARLEAGERPGLLLTDHHLGDVHGLDLVRRLRALDPTVPSLLHTAFADARVRQQAAQLHTPVLDKSGGVYALRDRVLALV